MSAIGSSKSYGRPGGAAFDSTSNATEFRFAEARCHRCQARVTNTPKPNPATNSETATMEGLLLGHLAGALPQGPINKAASTKPETPIKVARSAQPRLEQRPS